MRRGVKRLKLTDEKKPREMSKKEARKRLKSWSQRKFTAARVLSRGDLEVMHDLHLKGASVWDIGVLYGYGHHIVSKIIRGDYTFDQVEVKSRRGKKNAKKG